MIPGFQVIIVGAGILGLASAYHILQREPALELLVVDKKSGPGEGDTARSAAAFRDMFSSPVNRALSQGSIAFYDRIEGERGGIGLKKIGYLWLATARQAEERRAVLTSMARAGVRFKALEIRELSARLPDLRTVDLHQGILGLNCGILEPLKLIKFYEQEILRMGAQVRYRVEVSGFTLNSQALVSGIRTREAEISARTVIVAAGAWTGRLLAGVGIEVPITPRKRQLFSIPAREGPLHGLLTTSGFNEHSLLPFTILPGAAYLRPAPASFILGFANPDQPPGLEEPATGDRGFYDMSIRPQVERYFPVFQGQVPTQAWAGHYDDHLRDSTPFVEYLGGALVVAGSSGSGVMKADSLGRIAAGRLLGQESVPLGHGGWFKVADLGLQQRAVPPEEFVI